MADLLTVVAEMTAKPGKERDLQQALLALIEPTRKEEGCIQYDLHAGTDNPGRFVFYENWTSKEMLDRHSASPHLTAFREIAGDLLSEPARILLYKRIG